MAPMENHTPPMLDWRTLRLDQFDPTLLYAMLKLRTDVFVVEQACPYPELDDHDTNPRVLHLLGLAGDGAVAACLRILPPGMGYDTPSIGRVVIAAAFRGQGLADVLMRQGVEQAERAWPGHALRLGAQAHLQAWYGKHGFTPVSEVYLEDGIPHIDMQRDPAPDATRTTP